MRPQINSLNKSKFFALYLGLSVFDGENNIINHPIPYSPTEAANARMWACLRDISSISDEEAIEFTKMGGYLISHTMSPYQVKIHLQQFSPNHSRWATLGSHHIDYLRSIGICMPWMGYSVEELVSLGWVKLI